MADIRDLWWAAGQLAFDVSTNEGMNLRWRRAVRRSATLLEPAWPKHSSGGPFTYALPTVALLLYSGDLDSEPGDVLVEQIVAAFTPRPVGSSEPSIEDVVREGLTAGRGHDLDDDSQLSVLFRELTKFRPPLAYTESGFELTAFDHWPGGTLMGDSARWARYWLNYHHLGVITTG